MTAEEISAALERIRGAMGEYGKNFAFIIELEVGDGETQTVSTWSGNFNAAVGLAARMNERMRQGIIETDYPNDPPDDDSWREATT